jgi:AraC-like DNA-binding protein
MASEDKRRKRFAQLLTEVAAKEGVHPTQIEGVRVGKVSQSQPRTAVVYEPVIVFVAQGRKRTYLCDHVYEYDPSTYFVLSVPLPAECEWDATPDEPLLVLGLKVDPTTVGEILLAMDEPLSAVREMPQAVTTHTLGDQLGDAVNRLLECLKSPLDSQILGRQIVREIIYRVLREETDGALRSLANRHEHFMRIARVLREVHADCAKPFTVENMSKRAGMSIAAFHHNFKQVAGSSPLQYLKQIRLDRAKRLMIHDGHNASTAAKAVGYESASQFSREYRRTFGSPPLQNVAAIKVDA